jgi:hypothetical protein
MATGIHGLIWVVVNLFWIIDFLTRSYDVIPLDYRTNLPANVRWWGGGILTSK